MPRILCLDYGKKRTGIAVTDPLQIIATALITIETKSLVSYLQQYVLNESVEKILVGEPTNWDNSDTHATPLVRQFVQQLKKTFPLLVVEMVDERYTSKMAVKAMVDMGMKKKDRRVKGNVDQIAAAIMLQEYIRSKI